MLMLMMDGLNHMVVYINAKLPSTHCLCHLEVYRQHHSFRSTAEERSQFPTGCRGQCAELVRCQPTTAKHQQVQGTPDLLRENH